MLEELCRHSLHVQCETIIMADHPFVRLKGKPEPRREFEHFMSWDSGFTAWDSTLIRRRMDRRRSDLLDLAWSWFNTNAEQIIKGFIRDEYGNDLPAAMRENGSFEKLFDCFLKYFSERRNNFMEITKEMIDAQKLSISKAGKMPQSHGGVANLLKVLTKTMRDQGSSIRSIAKVQYYVCIQAGIYIPDEFITDVLVGANIEEGAANGNDNH